MSIPVDVADLAKALTDFGAGYLLTSSAEGRVKAVTVEPGVEDGVVVVPGPGKGSTANIAVNPDVTLLFPPREHHGFTLLVDGTATVEGGPDGTARITPATAVLHRPASHADGPGRAPAGRTAARSTDDGVHSAVLDQRVPRPRTRGARARRGLLAGSDRLRPVAPAW
ncbi:pyridoxamine 5'-phosphate oxidase family protein [Nocardioides ungokensis]|uniref:pyridoxamine 5'-phosphate oxidase family protein n=1 Tax=Nocardioides ungokensis TaxID=1643322 RepID=UPI001FE91562|nr:pyridoxamine 5'-phosphate oxidase family protein [Nocardioides ungokensis]